MPATSGRPRARGKDPADTADQAILAAKLGVPGLPEWIVPRDRIDRLITVGARGPVTVLTGPPGAGKTMALASWAARPGAGPVAWVTLDSWDNRPRMFWSHVAEALRRAGVTPPGRYRQPQAAVGYVRRLAVTLADLDRDVTLVLDDLHHVSAAECLDGVEYLARYAGHLHVLVASRMDPLLHLQRLRVGGQLTEIRARDLAFTSGEVGQLLRLHGIDLPAATVGRLTERSEGWAAGVRLAALTMREHPEPEQVAERFAAANGPVTGYLVTEVLDREPAEVRRLMLVTSVADRLCTSLATELSGGTAPAATVPALARANAFVQPAGEEWYRYYPPLAEVLRLKLQEEYPDEVRPLQLRAAGWLHRNGYLDEAVRLAARAAGDWALAAGMVVEDFAVGQLVEPQAGERLADALASGPATPGRADARSLVVAAALATRRHRDAEAARLLRAADRALARAPAGAEWPGRLGAATVALELARRSGNLPAAEAAAGQARGLLSRMPAALLEPRAAARAQLLAAIGIVDMWADRFDDAATALEHSVLAGNRSGWQADGSANLALVEAIRGRLSHARTLAGAALHGGAEHAGAAAAVALAWVRLEQGQLALARTELTHAERALDARPDMVIGALRHVVAARYRLAKGQPGIAAEIVRADRASWAPPAWLDQLLVSAEVRALTEAGDTRRALAAAGATATAALVPALARAWLASGDVARAGQAVATAKAASARRGWRGGRVEAELAGAELAYASGDPAGGRRSVQAALRFAQPEQVRLPFTLERAWLQPVLRRDNQLAEEFRMSLADGPARPGRATGSLPPVVEQLSGREREVLGYASQMLSTAEIAEEMYLSVNTVKSHLRTILRKLGAGHRREAVRRARELQLL